jgi:magnesium transporter
VESLVHRQDMPRHQLVEGLVHKQHLSELKTLLDRMPPDRVARILEALPQDDSVLVWEMVAADRGDEILDELSDALRETFSAAQAFPRKPVRLNAFDLQNGRLRQIPIDCRDDLARAKPIWVDLVAPSREERRWIDEIFGLRLPDADDLTDLEESARFYIEENGEVHLHSAFLLDKQDESRNVAVAFILHDNILFSTRDEELPVFRLQRLRARIQPGYVTDGKDVLRYDVVLTQVSAAPWRIGGVAPDGSVVTVKPFSSGWREMMISSGLIPNCFRIEVRSSTFLKTAFPASFWRMLFRFSLNDSDSSL